MEGKISVKADSTWIIVDDDGEADFDIIQEAINNATSGDMIFVRAGIYFEHVIVNKSVSLVGEERDSTIVDGNGTDSVISITANYVRIKGFTVKRSGRGPYDSGVFVNHSSGNDVSHNTMTNNSNGISLYFSSYNTVSDNTMTNNSNGMYLALYTMNNIIYCNNFNNTCQVRTHDSTNVWDYGNQGNYWSDYAKQDLNGDGIGDEPYFIDVNNQDNHPLMGMFSDFNVTLERETYQVTTICNSTISEFRFEIKAETGNRIIGFNVTGKDSTVGFCRITIPTHLMNYPYIVMVDVDEIIPTLLDVSNETYVHLYFTYIHSSHTIRIISSLARKLQIDLYNLNTTYYELQNNYSIFLGNYSELQKSYLELNKSYQNNLSDISKNVHNIRNLMYIFAATTAIFIITTIYLSKHAHAARPEYARARERRLERNEV